MKPVEQPVAAGNRFGRLSRRFTLAAVPRRQQRGTIRNLMAGALVLALWLAVSGTAMAQRKKADEEAPKKSYVGSYFIVIAGLGAGLTALLRANSRLDRPPPKVVDDDMEEED